MRMRMRITSSDEVDEDTASAGKEKQTTDTVEQDRTTGRVYQEKNEYL
jgi:hypothetical protein